MPDTNHPSALRTNIKIEFPLGMCCGKPVRRVIRIGRHHILGVAPAGRPRPHKISHWMAIGIGHDHEGPIGGVKKLSVNNQGSIAKVARLSSTWIIGINGEGRLRDVIDK